MENGTSTIIDIVPLLYQLRHSNAAQYASDPLTKADAMSALYSVGDFVTLCICCYRTCLRRSSQFI